MDETGEPQVIFVAVSEEDLLYYFEREKIGKKIKNIDWLNDDCLKRVDDVTILAIPVSAFKEGEDLKGSPLNGEHIFCIGADLDSMLSNKLIGGLFDASVKNGNIPSIKHQT